MSFSIGEECVGCTACARMCPVFAISGERGECHEINAKRCVECGVCARICPKSAVRDARGARLSPVPKSEWLAPKIDAALCSACGMCAYACTKGALSISLPAFRGDIGVFAVLSSPEKCVGCGICESECPLHAITMAKKEAAK